jgi:hypothetical protein
MDESLHGYKLLVLKVEHTNQNKMICKLFFWTIVLSFLIAKNFFMIR